MWLVYWLLDRYRPVTPFMCVACGSTVTSHYHDCGAY